MANAASLLDTVRVRLTGELGRRLVHASGSVLPALYLLNLANWHQIRILYVAGTVLGVILEVLRLFGGLELAIFEHLTREYEQEAIAGYMLYTLSSTAVALVFQPQIAIPSILMLTLGDPISGLASSGEFRRVKRPSALAAMFLVSTAIALPFVPEAPLAAVLGGLGSMTADGVKPIVRGYIIDDNLTIPPVAAIAMLVGIALTGLL